MRVIIRSLNTVKERSALRLANEFARVMRLANPNIAKTWRQPRSILWKSEYPYLTTGYVKTRNPVRTPMLSRMDHPYLTAGGWHSPDPS